MLIEDVMNAPEPTPEPVPPEPVAPAPPADLVVPTEPAEPVAAAPAEPVAPEPPVEPEPEPLKFRLPGEQPEANETDWLRQNYAQALNQIAALKQQVEAFQLEGLDDAELAAEKLRRQQADLAQQIEQMRQQQAHQGWKDYYQQFLPEDKELSQLPDAVQMGHRVLTTLTQQLNQTKKELEALKKAAQPPQQQPPRVAASGGGQGGQTVFRDLITDPKRYETLLRKALMGQLSPGDIPPL